MTPPNPKVTAPRKRNNVVLKTVYEYPPIPIRTCDWSARDDNTYEPGDICGWGATEAEAIADFWEQWEENQ